MTKEDFTTKMQAQTLRNEIIDCEMEIADMMKTINMKREESRDIRRRLHDIENPGKPYIDTDLF